MCIRDRPCGGRDPRTGDLQEPVRRKPRLGAAGDGQLRRRAELADIAAHGDRRVHRLGAGEPAFENHLGVEAAKREGDVGRRSEWAGSPDDAHEVRRKVGSREQSVVQGDCCPLLRSGPHGQGRRSREPPHVDHPP